MKLTLTMRNKFVIFVNVIDLNTTVLCNVMSW